MHFVNPDQPLSESDIQTVERNLDLEFPAELRELFLKHNGAEPEPYVLENDELRISTVVSRTLPLLSMTGNGTAVQSYHRLVTQMQLTPHNYFPFAVDGGGDYFMIDCISGVVSFLKSDPVQLIKLGVGLSGFWDLLKDD
ncbi:SMI1/KNR4 family protein [uncultured Gimesia sp.]|uniref:SMI1/KNR4 family protein n=1 Tax=uncultured Gimesia sp. TaxID=1678688 RepID=UPI0030DA35E9|tara:strand:- start:1876 stop:2295 length:420 start_codon:yes stop_codon:yes gene_type:complete